MEPPGLFTFACLGAEDLGPCFEAARWSASSGNSQPWRFAVGFRGDSTFTDILSSLVEGNAIWAKHASALVANIATIRNDEGKDQSHAVYDVGQAVAHFSVQATAEGFVVHQMGALMPVGLPLPLPCQILSGSSR